MNTPAMEHPSKNCSPERSLNNLQQAFRLLIENAYKKAESLGLLPPDPRKKS